MPSGRRPAGGFAYLLLLAVVAIISIGTVASVRLGVAAHRKEAEAHLLTIGAEFERAFASYRATAPNGVWGANPRSLEQLLRDPRYPGIKRHLRQVYSDPMTGSPVWGLVKAPDGSILAVYSLGAGVPLQQAGFTAPWGDFVRARSYAQWTFGLPAQDRLQRAAARAGEGPRADDGIDQDTGVTLDAKEPSPPNATLPPL